MWDMNWKCNLIEFDPPQDYPIEMILSNGKLQSSEVMFDELKSVVKIGTTKLVDG